MKQFEESASAATTADASAGIGPHPPWNAKTIWIAAVLALLGAVPWVKDVAQPPARGTAAGGPSKAGFADSTSSQEPHRALKPTSPASSRQGVSYIGGFFLGWAFRRFLKLTLLGCGTT